MLLLLLSLLPILAGPLVVRLLQASPPVARLLDSFILVSVGGLVALHILPHAIAEGGLWALGAAVVGLLVPFVAEHLVHHRKSLSFSPLLLLGLVALAIHGVLDGLAIAAPHSHARGGELLAAAVILHRLPAGLAIWWLVRPRLGSRGAWLIVGLLAVATVVGYLAALFGWPGLFAGGLWYIVQALLSGSLVHIVFHQSLGPASPHEGARWQPFSALGGLIAVAALVALPLLQGEGGEAHAHGAHGLGEAFMHLVRLAAPPVLLAYVLGALLHVISYRGGYRFVAHRRGLAHTLSAALAGLLFSPCSCAQTDRYFELQRRGLRPGAALAFLASASEIGVAPLLLSVPLLGAAVGGLRIGLSLAVALVAALVVHGLARGIREREDDHHHHHHASSAESTVPSGLELFRRGLSEAVDQTLPWLLVGLGAAAFLEPVLHAEDVALVPGWLHVPLLTAIGTPLYVCAAGSLPIVAMLLTKGFSVGAGLAFLLVGPITNAATFRLLAMHLGGKRAAWFSTLLVGLVLVAGWGVDALGIAAQDVLATEPHGFAASLADVAVAILGVALAITVARQGIPRFLAVVLELHGHRHDHVHGDLD